MSADHIVCSHCGTINSVPAARRGEGPKCGNCKKSLFAGKPVDLNAAAFDRFVTKNQIPVLVDFWAPWCQPCLVMAPAFAEAAVRLEPDVRLAKLNTEEEQMIGAQQGIRSIPTMILFHNGKELARQSGAMNAATIERWVREQLSG